MLLTCYFFLLVIRNTSFFVYQMLSLGHKMLKMFSLGMRNINYVSFLYFIYYFSVSFLLFKLNKI